MNAPGGVVQLRNLTVHGNGATFGISYQSGAQLLIENVKVYGFTQDCIRAFVQDDEGTDNLVIKDTSIENCTGCAINTSSLVGLNTVVINTHTSFTDGGLAARGSSTSVYHSTFSGTFSSSSERILKNGGVMILDDCLVSGWEQAVVVGIGGSIQLNGNTITDNGTALVPSGGPIFSYGNNALYANEANGSATVVSLQ